MSRKPQKTKKINRYCLWMSGAQHLYFKEETLVCFPPSRPNKMRYSSINSARTRKTYQTYLPSIMITNFTLYHFGCPHLT